MAGSPSTGRTDAPGLLMRTTWAVRVRGAVVVTGLAASLTLSGCGAQSADAPGGPQASAAGPATPAGSSEPIVLEAGTSIVRVEDAEDIAQWGSWLLEVEVIGEKARNSSPAGEGESYVGRDVLVRVDAVVWGHADGVTPVRDGEEMTLYTFPGYVEQGGDRRPAVEEGTLRMEVGGRYAAVVADDVVDDRQVLTLIGTLPIEGAAIRLPNGSSLTISSAREALAAIDPAVPVGPRSGESLVERLERWSDG